MLVIKHLELSLPLVRSVLVGVLSVTNVIITLVIGVVHLCFDLMHIASERTDVLLLAGELLFNAHSLLLQHDHVLLHLPLN